MRKAISLLVCLMLLLSLSMTAYAHEVPDESRKGSIEVAMTYQGKAVPGGTLTFYRVGAIHEEDGNYSFVPTGDFADCGESFEDLQSPTLAEDLAKIAAKAEGTKVTIGKDGKAKAENLELGLYLVVQTKEADGYNAVNPFLVSLPKVENGAYVYDVDATPKMGELTPAPTEETKETNKPSDSKLPQTGQLNWPVPVLAAAGLVLFAIGWALRFRKKKGNYEK